MLGLSLLLAMAAADYTLDRARICRPIVGAEPAVAALNRFWDIDVRLCESDDPEDSAAALTRQGVVLANTSWLAEVVEDYGAPAAVGILAHEWAHMAYPELSGRVGELQADCLAGAFMRGARFDQRAMAGFARISLDSGDRRRRWQDGHGTGSERRAAVLRGYEFRGDRGRPLLAFCMSSIS
jgi:hypothetical protein